VGKVLKFVLPPTEDEPQQQLVNLPERTGKHFCVHCLAEVDGEVFMRNDHLCDACVGDDVEAAV
jgi:hypothetical protein